ncbi:polysaccharide pyruvyl transferase family protein [Candidatus Bathyarchaeota archaeon]|nr:polysaccharide pyruvyl transferase family protein [Candidatus Bathyarchaeota archaeon]
MTGLKLVVFGGWFGSGNLGDEAILIGLRNVLRRAIPGVEITALSTDPEYTKRVCGVEAVKLQSPRSLVRNREQYLTVFDEADGCIVSGGTPIYDYGHLSRAIHMALPVLKGKKLVFFGVGAKPLESFKGREVTRLLLRAASLISTRDNPSRAILMQLTSVPIMVTGDSALHMEPAEAEDPREPTALFCPRFLSAEYRRSYHQPLTAAEMNKTRHMVARTADHLASLGYRVRFAPFHVAPQDDDRLEITRVMRLMKSRSAEEMPRPSSPGDALLLMGSASVVVGLRLHSLVLAALMGVPVASVGYDIKIDGFMELAGAEQYLCHPGDGLDALSKRVDRLLEDGDEARRAIADGVERMRRRISGESVKAARLLQG